MGTDAKPSKKRPREEWSTQGYTALVDLIHKADEIRMFHEPVREEDVPGYHAVIPDPIDLRTIREKLVQTERYRTGDGGKQGYKRGSDVLADLRRMFHNALEFNERGDPYYKHAQKLYKALPKWMQEAGVTTEDERSRNKGDEDDGDDGDYVPTGAVHDVESSLVKAEKREDWQGTLKGLEEDLETPLEELRARLAAAAAAAKDRVSSSDDDDDDDDDEDSDDTSDSDDDDSDEEDEETTSDDDDVDDDDDTDADGEANKAS